MATAWRYFLPGYVQLLDLNGVPFGPKVPGHVWIGAAGGARMEIKFVSNHGETHSWTSVPRACERWALFDEDDTLLFSAQISGDTTVQPGHDVKMTFGEVPA